MVTEIFKLTEFRKKVQSTCKVLPQKKLKETTQPARHMYLIQGFEPTDKVIIFSAVQRTSHNMQGNFAPYIIKV